MDSGISPFIFCQKDQPQTSEIPFRDYSIDDILPVKDYPVEETPIDLPGKDYPLESSNNISDNLVKLSPVKPEQVVTTKVPAPDYPVDEIVDQPGLEQVALEETPLYRVPVETNNDLVEKDNTVNSLPPEERVSDVLFKEFYSTYDSS